MKFKTIKYILKKHNHKKGLKNWSLDWWDNTKTSFCVFWDFKYKRERKRKKKLLKAGEMERIPLEKAISKDVKNMGYRANPAMNSMKYVKTKGGAVVVTPASLRAIKEDYKDAELVEARIKSHDALKEEYEKASL